MAVDMFLELKGIDGESQDDTFSKKNAIDVLAWSWGMSQSGTTHMGSGGGSGKVSVQDLSVTKYVDKASPNLLLFCSNGEHIPEAKLTVRKAGKTPLEYIVITMTEVIISSVSTGGSGGQDRLTENISLNFEKVKLTYTPQKSTGAGDTAIDYKWDIAKNISA